MRKLKMIAAFAMSTMALACTPAPALADEVHPWCGVLVGTAAMVVAQPEDVREITEAIMAHPTATKAQKIDALSAAEFGWAIHNSTELSDSYITEMLNKYYNACLKEHA
jgi:hypothetical protein